MILALLSVMYALFLTQSMKMGKQMNLSFESYDMHWSIKTDTNKDIEEQVPESDWLWQRCLYAFLYNKRGKCHFCPDQKGAMVLTTKRVVYNKFTNKEDTQKV